MVCAVILGEPLQKWLAPM